MATNPKKSESQLADRFDRPLIGDAQTLIVDVATTGATNTTPYGFTTAAQADAIVSRVNLIIAALVSHGLVKDA